MGKVFAEITMSLDGFVAAPNIDVSRPLGDDGERLHDWLFVGTANNTTDHQVADEFFANTGAFIIGRRTFDLGIGAWGDDGAFGEPCFVITSRPQDVLVKGPTTFNFVTDGITSGLEKAKAAAGDKEVCVMGGADIIQQYLKAGLVDELRLHIAPLLLGGGTRLFEHLGTEPTVLERTRVIESPFAAHLIFRIVK